MRTRPTRQLTTCSDGGYREWLHSAVPLCDSFGRIRLLALVGLPSRQVLVVSALARWENLRRPSSPMPRCMSGRYPPFSPAATTTGPSPGQ